MTTPYRKMYTNAYNTTMSNGQHITQNTHNRIEIGTQALLLINKEEVVYRFTSTEESDPLQNIISIESPLGKGLLGKKEGDVLTVSIPTGDLIITVLEVS